MHYEDYLNLNNPANIDTKKICDSCWDDSSWDLDIINSSATEPLRVTVDSSKWTIEQKKIAVKNMLKGNTCNKCVIFNCTRDICHVYNSCDNYHNIKSIVEDFKIWANEKYEQIIQRII